MYTIVKEFGFEASHHLVGLRPGHPCMRMHGHSYKVKIELKSSVLTPEGFVVDYRELDTMKKLIDTLDHRTLNDEFDCNPTVENMSKELYDKFKSINSLVSAVELSETDKTNCRYAPDDQTI